MQILTTTAIISLLFLSTSAFPRRHGVRPTTTNIAPSASPLPTGLGAPSAAADIDPSLVPVFSIKAGTGIGANGAAIPKTCPPARADFIAKLSTNVAAGNVLGTPITFNKDVKVQDTKTNQNRATAMIITLQSFTGVKGVGCPGASTPELISQQKTGVASA